MSACPDPFVRDVLQFLIDRLSPAPGDRQCLLAMCDASELVWESFQALLRRAVRQDTDRFLREARARSTPPIPRHTSRTGYSEVSIVRVDDPRNVLRVGSGPSGSSSVSRSFPTKAMPHRTPMRSRSRSRRRS